MRKGLGGPAGVLAELVLWWWWVCLVWVGLSARAAATLCTHAHTDTYRRPLVLSLDCGGPGLRPLAHPVVDAQLPEEVADEGEPDQEEEEGRVAQQDLGLLVLQVVEALLPSPLEVREGCFVVERA